MITCKYGGTKNGRDGVGQGMNSEKPWEVWDSEQVDELMRLWWGPINGKKGRHQKLMKEVSELITGRTVLDVACGPGYLLSFLKKDIKYLGVDSSPAMISRARSYKRKASFVLGSAYDLSNFENADTVVCVDLIRHLPETWPVLEQLWMKTLISLILVVEIGVKPRTIKSKRPEGKYLINRIETMPNMMNLFYQLPSLKGIEKINFDNLSCIFRLWKKRTARRPSN